MGSEQRTNDRDVEENQNRQNSGILLELAIVNGLFDSMTEQISKVEMKCWENDQRSQENDQRFSKRSWRRQMSDDAAPGSVVVPIVIYQFGAKA